MTINAVIVTPGKITANVTGASTGSSNSSIILNNKSTFNITSVVGGTTQNLVVNKNAPIHAITNGAVGILNPTQLSFINTTDINANVVNANNVLSNSINNSNTLVTNFFVSNSTISNSTISNSIVTNTFVSNTAIVNVINVANINLNILNANGNPGISEYILTSGGPTSNVYWKAKAQYYTSTQMYDYTAYGLGWMNLAPNQDPVTLGFLPDVEVVFGSLWILAINDGLVDPLPITVTSPNTRTTPMVWMSPDGSGPYDPVTNPNGQAYWFNITPPPSGG